MGPLNFYIPTKLPESDLTEDHPERLPACVATTLADGTRLAPAPLDVDYRGYANLVTGQDEQNWAIHSIKDAPIPDWWNNTRLPSTKPELQISVLRITVVSASAKTIAGPTGDDRKDLQDDGVTSKVWAVVLPVWEHIGSPVESKANQVTAVPEHPGGSKMPLVRSMLSE